MESYRLGSLLLCSDIVYQGTKPGVGFGRALFTRIWKAIWNTTTKLNLVEFDIRHGKAGFCRHGMFYRAWDRCWAPFRNLKANIHIDDNTNATTCHPTTTGLSTRIVQLVFADVVIESWLAMFHLSRYLIMQPLA